MDERIWISQEKMFWKKSEWDEAYSDVSAKENFNNLSGDEKMNLIIGYLIKKYPVSMHQLREAKEKYA